MNQLDVRVIAAVILIFALTYFALRKTFFEPLIDVMERRRARIEHAAAMRLESREAVEAARERAQALIAEAKRQAEETSRESRERTETERQAKLDEARARAEQLLVSGRAEIAEVRLAEQARVRDEAVDCVVLACHKILGRSDRSVVESTVDRLMARKVQ